jgi:hypothetical protein
MNLNPVSAIVEAGGKILDKVIPDLNAREKAKEELAKVAQDQDFQITMAQLAINKAEAESTSLFKGGWRPYIGWTCGTAFSLHFVIFPIVDKITAMFGNQPVSIPFDMNTLLTVLFALLGIGGMRSWEKYKGVA